MTKFLKNKIKSAFILFVQLVIAQAEYAESLTSLDIYITDFMAKNIF